MKEREQKEHKNGRTIFMLAQSGCICVLIVIVVVMMMQINRLQGTARVINYAGLVRGETQRLIKLEITENPNDELIQYLDDIIGDLKAGNGTYGLVKLEDHDYQTKLDELLLYWEELKKQIHNLRQNHSSLENRTTLLEMSEVYFGLADGTVSAAEIYSDKIARWIRILEIMSAVDMCILLVMIVYQTWITFRMRKRNAVLAQKAYVDTQTGLQNKNRCEELLDRKEILQDAIACIVFDINNLKTTNDTMGHLIGDRLIEDFAKALRKVVRERDFAGRCGGDEFLLVLYGVDEQAVQNVLQRLEEEVEQSNAKTKHIPISYAHGWSISTDYKKCTFRMLFHEADRSMYRNKRNMKEVL